MNNTDKFLLLVSLTEILENGYGIEESLKFYSERYNLPEEKYPELIKLMKDFDWEQDYKYKKFEKDVKEILNSIL